MFTLHHIHPSGVRRGTLQTAHGGIETPFFMPIATKGAVKGVSPLELSQIEQAVDPGTSPVVLSNTYHLYLRPGLEVLSRLRGLHGMMRWDHAILTDSGGFQVFSLAKLRTLSDDGVEFGSHIDGSKHLFTPERSMEIQAAIGADIWMAFDYFPGYPADPEDAARSVRLTTSWARRCRQWFDANADARQHQLFGIVQGSTDPELRAQSAEELQQIGFGGYAVGGLAVGEPPEEMYAVLDATTPLLPEQKPRYLMGVGPPEQILGSVKRGIDMFDCVIPTRNARHGSLFVHKPESPVLVDKSLSSVQYDKLSITAEQWADDRGPVDPHCSCELCTRYSRAYLRHLFSVGEPLAARLASVHNITFFMQLMKEIRTNA